jgi:bifunctional DNA-binding transcriptional regulator/antitoxin component of YhaV-PrlF toxin-antitoxin module
VASETVQVGTGGAVPLPSEVRRKDGVKVGDPLTVVDVGGSVLLMLPGHSTVERSGHEVAAALRRMPRYGVCERLDQYPGSMARSGGCFWSCTSGT